MYITGSLVLALRRGSRTRISNRLHVDTVDPEDVRAKDFRNSPLKKTVNQAASRRADENDKLRQAQSRAKRKDALHTEDAKYEEGANRRKDARLDEEEGLSPATRDVKHFSEAMHDECDMEPCNTVKRKSLLFLFILLFCIGFRLILFLSN